MRVAGQIINRITDQVVILGLFYDPEMTLIAKGLNGVTGRSQEGGEAWNAHLWEL